jgi:DNA-binding transcriptional LysR family regulator
VSARPAGFVDDAVVGVDRTDLDLLRAIGETHDLRAGAKLVGLTQRAAERRLVRLERRLRVKLATVDADEIRLTAGGERVLTAATRLRAELGKIIGQLLVRPEPASPLELSALRIAGIGRSCEDWLTDDLATRLDKLVLTALSADPVEARRLFERNCVDAAYGWQVAGEQIRMERRSAAMRVLDEPLWVVLPASHPAAARDVVSLADLAEDEWVVGPWPDTELLSTAAAAAGFTPRIGNVIASRSVRRSLLLHGRGVGLVSPVSRPLSGSAAVCRPLREQVVRQYVLRVDPEVVGPALHILLRDRLRAGYHAVAAARNPSYAASAAFPLPAAEIPGPMGPIDTAVLAGLPAHSADDGERRAEPEVESADIHLLRAISGCGSINRAATLLSITQPALSRRLSRLETRLGMRLLARGPRGAALTELGRQLVELAADPEAAFRAELDSVRSRQMPTVARPAVVRPAPARPRSAPGPLPGTAQRPGPGRLPSAVAMR